MSCVAMAAAASPVQLCALRAIEAARHIRAVVQRMPLAERGRTVDAALKPGAAITLQVDRTAEDIAIAAFERLADEVGYRLHLIVDPARAQVIELGRSPQRQVIFAYLDAIDGTIKVGGLCNDVAAGKIRVASDGNWGVAAAFTEPTDRRLEQLRFADFAGAAVLDGNPLRYRAHPEEVVAVPVDGTLASYDLSEAPAVTAALRRAPRLYTSTNEQLQRGIVFFDAFQAFDVETRQAGDDVIAVELYRRLLNRHAGGAFDVVRQYGSLSALLHSLLGWRGEPPWMESQGVAFVVVNENLANLIPALPIVAGAGGVSVDFDGRPIGARKLVEGRCSVIHAAGTAVCDAVLRLVAEARASAAT
jgi:hypothetical protein